MTVLGIDYGLKRVGLAFAYPDERPERFAVVESATAVDAIQQAVQKYQISTVVVGLPRNLDGDDTAQTKLARKFGEKLKDAMPEITVVLQDEADTSNIARMRLGQAGMKEYDIKQWLDAEAAVIILEDYLQS